MNTKKEVPLIRNPSTPSVRLSREKSQCIYATDGTEMYTVKNKFITRYVIKPSVKLNCTKI